MFGACGTTLCVLAVLVAGRAQAVGEECAVGEAGARAHPGRGEEPPQEWRRGGASPAAQQPQQQPAEPQQPQPHQALGGFGKHPSARLRHALKHKKKRSKKN